MRPEDHIHLYIDRSSKQADEKHDGPQTARAGLFSEMLFANFPRPAFIYDRQNLKYLDVNRAAVEFYGYSREEFLSMTLYDIRPEAERQRIKSYVESMDFPVRDSGVWEHRRKDGSHVLVSIVAGNIVHNRREAAFAIVEDITQKLEAECRLAFSEERARLALESSHMGTFDWNLATGQVVWSPSHASLLREPDSDIVGSYEAFLKQVHSDDRARLEQALKQSAETGEVCTYEYRIVLADGQIRYIEGIAEFFFDEERQPVRMVGILRDVTEQRPAQGGLDQNEALLLAASTACAQAVLVLSVPEAGVVRIEAMNAAFEAMVGQSPGKLAGLSLDEACARLPDALASDLARQTGACLAAKAPSHAECTFEQNDRTVTVQSLFEPLIDASGDVCRIVGRWTDITELRSTCQRLQTLNEQKTCELGDEIAKRVKAEQRLVAINGEFEMFAHSISHDLRAPLRAVSGFSMMLLEDYGEKLDATGREYIDVISKAVSQLKTQIEDLIGLARLGRGLTQPTEFNLEDAITSAVAAMENQINAWDADISVRTEPLTLKGFQTPVIELIKHLLDNAIKFVPPDKRPKVQVQACRVGDSIELSVSDNGIGIDPQDAQRVFQPFERLNAKEAFPGTGIGLAVALKAAHLHHGLIRVESTMGEGSTFTAIFYDAEPLVSEPTVKTGSPNVTMR